MTKINTIYIIDDDAITLFGVKKLLDKIVEYDRVYEFKNGKTALNTIAKRLALANEIPDVIFLDINMPIMDGWEFLEEFIKLPISKKIVINIITSSIDPLDEKKWKDYQNRTTHKLAFKNKPLLSIDLEELIVIDLAS
jgi:CheY-like chemotaxis protein